MATGGTPVPRLLGITPPEFATERLRELLPELSSRLDAVLLRWPHRSAREILAAARTLAELSPRPLLLLSDRLDIALLAGVEGVQLGERGIPAGLVPSSLRPSLVGISRHDAEGLRATVGASFATLSPVRASSSKPGVPPLGLDAFGGLVRHCSIPVLALGGIRPQDLAGVLERGGYGAAVLSGIFGAADPPAAAAEYAAALREARRA